MCSATNSDCSYLIRQQTQAEEIRQTDPKAWAMFPRRMTGNWWFQSVSFTAKSCPPVSFCSSLTTFQKEVSYTFHPDILKMNFSSFCFVLVLLHHNLLKLITKMSIHPVRKALRTKEKMYFQHTPIKMQSFYTESPKLDCRL